MTARGRKAHGSAMVELALVMPPLLLLVVGVADFGRAFYAAIEVQGAAEAGALAGSRSVPNASKTDMITAAAKNDAADLDRSTVSVSPTKYCQCSGSTTRVSCRATCASGNVRMYLEVTATRTFKPMLGYPKVPVSVPISDTVVIRVQ